MSEFTAWELETIFHIISNKVQENSLALDERAEYWKKISEIASKAIKQQIENFPDYNHGIKKIVEDGLKN